MYGVEDSVSKILVTNDRGRPVWVHVKSPIGQKHKVQNPHGQKPNNLTAKWSKAPSMRSIYPITIWGSSDMIHLRVTHPLTCN